MQAEALGLMATGTVVSAIGQYRQGQAQEAAYNYNAQVTERKAAQDEYESRQRLKKLMASQRALYAKAGVDLSSGSPLLLLSETAGEGEREALAIRQGGTEEAGLQRFYGKQAYKAGKTAAFSTLLTGMGNAGTSYYEMSQRKK